MPRGPDLGPVGEPADRFDTASLQYVGYEVHVPEMPDSTRIDLAGCAFVRLRTGVIDVGSRSTIVGIKEHTLTLRGTTGSDLAGQWIPGEYQVRCEAQGIIIQPKNFTVFGRVEGTQSVVSLSSKAIPQALTKSMQFFESGYESPPLERRQYFTRITGRPRYVAAEVKIIATRPPRRSRR